MHCLATSKAHPNVVIRRASQNDTLHLSSMKKLPFQLMIFKIFFGCAEIMIWEIAMVGLGGRAKKQSL